jgi:hypothetical protein
MMVHLWNITTQLPIAYFCIPAGSCQKVAGRKFDLLMARQNKNNLILVLMKPNNGILKIDIGAVIHFGQPSGIIKN